MWLRSRAEVDRIMGERGWLCLVPKTFREEVLRRAQLQHFLAGKPVFHLGDPAGGIYGLVSGAVSVSIAPAGAAPRLVLLGVPGHWTGEACFLTRQPRRGEFRAVSDTTLLHLPLQALDQMAALDPQVIRYVAFILMMSVEFLLRVVHDLQKPAPDRRIASILQRATSTGGQIPLTQTQLGIMANTSRKQVNVALRRFSEAGWLENTYRSVKIIDMAALHHFAESDDAD